MSLSWKSLVASTGIALCVVLTGIAALNDTPPLPPGTITFYKDVLPVLQKNCQGCHHSGEAAPMSLLTYADAKSWLPAIRMAVLSKKMPPWYADPQYGHFSNERKLTPQEIRTLVSWMDTGAREGDPKDQPAPLQFNADWSIGTPDEVLEMPAAFSVPAEGTVAYQYVLIPGHFAHDTWIKAAEIQPGNRSVVHHVIAMIRPPGSPWMKNLKPGEFFDATKRSPQPSQHGNSDSKEIIQAEEPTPITEYTPGLQPLELGTRARLVPAGSDIILQLHYTSTGTTATDKTRIGLIYAKEPPKLRSVQFVSRNMDFTIPPNDPNYEVRSQVLLEKTTTLTDLMPHMHFRGKDFLVKAIYPDGKTETLLSVPNYDFNWQLVYRLDPPRVLLKGTRLECIAHFDNSVNNPHNPDPTQAVKWGEQTWEEMMGAFFSLDVDPKTNINEVVKSEKPGTRMPPRLHAKSAGTVTGGGSRNRRD